MVERTNEEWSTALGGPQKDRALSDLRAILVRGLHFALGGRVQDNQLEALVEDSVQETLLKILDKLDTFQGRSRFTTWAHKIAIRVAYTELRRLRWKDISLEDILPEDSGVDFTPQIMKDPSPTPEGAVTRSWVMATVQRLIMEELTERQRKAMIAVMFRGMPLEEVARRMGTNRNALYKLLHDARLRLKKRLAVDGLTPQELLSVFDS